VCKHPDKSPQPHHQSLSRFQPEQKKNPAIAKNSLSPRPLRGEGAKVLRTMIIVNNLFSVPLSSERG